MHNEIMIYVDDMSIDLVQRRLQLLLHDPIHGFVRQRIDFTLPKPTPIPGRDMHWCYSAKNGHRPSRRNLLCEKINVADD